MNLIQKLVTFLGPPHVY